MAPLRRWWARITATLRRRQHDEEFRAELQSHLQFMVEERIARGMSEPEARREALLQLGGIAQLEESHRDWRGASWLEASLRDLRHAQRSIRRDLGFLLASLAVVALGIGAGTAVFSVARYSLFRPLPYKEPARLLSIGMTLPWVGDQEFLFGRSYTSLTDNIPPIFSGVASSQGVADCQLDQLGILRHTSCARVEASFLGVLGIRPALGRDFTDAEDQPGAPHVVLLSQQFWVKAYGADPNAVGRTMILDDTTARIIGVLPGDFELPGGEAFEIMVPQRLDRQRQRVATPGDPLRVLARLSPEATVTGAVSALEPLLQVGTLPQHLRDTIQLRVRPVRDLRFRDRKLAFGLLAGSAVCLFLTTCANLGFLLLARAAARRRERQLRIALGADSASLVRQSLGEAILVCLPGGLLGIALAYLLLQGTAPLLPGHLREFGQARIDAPALLFALGCAGFTAILLGCLPVLSDRRSFSLNANRSVGTPPHASRFRQILVVSQLALCIALIGAAATFLNSLWRLRVDSAKFARERITTASFILAKSAYSSTDAQTVFYHALEARLAGAGMFSAVAVSDSLPPTGVTRSQPLAAIQAVPGGSRPEPGSGGLVLWRFVSAGYFDALRIRVVRGRVFTPADTGGGPVAVVNETLARRLFGSPDAVGQTIRASDEPGFEIIGVVEDVRNDASLREAQPEYYVLRQPAAAAVYRNQQPPFGWRRASVVVRSPLPDSTVRALLSAEFKQIAPEVELTVQTMEERFDVAGESTRFQAATLVSFGVVALLLAAVGVYGLVSFLVVERTHEFAVRLALGASTRHIWKLVLGRTLLWTIYGALGGTLLGVAVARLLRSYSQEIVHSDPLSYAVAIAVLSLVALLAAGFPAARAALTDPAAILRQ